MSTFNHDAPNNPAVQSAEDIAEEAERLARYFSDHDNVEPCNNAGFHIRARENVHKAGLIKQKADHLARYHRCKNKLDMFNRAEIQAWLSRLDEQERELCRTTLNNLLDKRRQKRQGVSYVQRK